MSRHTGRQAGVDGEVGIGDVLLDGDRRSAGTDADDDGNAVLSKVDRRQQMSRYKTH